jgi:dihydrofolate synthase/folylpolyglutamate synthase
MRGKDWSVAVGEAIEYADRHGRLALPLPALPGEHQADNAALAVAMLRLQDRVTVSARAMADGIRAARWPARLQLLCQGPLAALARGHELWLDGGHNADAGAAIARHFAGRRLHLVAGMLANRDPAAILGPLAPHLASLSVVPIPGSDAHEAAAFGPEARPAESTAAALRRTPPDGLPILIAGSLYLAGAVLSENGHIPD